MKETWQTLLNKAQVLYKEAKDERRKSNLRFNASFLPVYEIASQFFCEKQVDICGKLGEVKTDAALKGIELHESLSEGMERTKDERIFEEISSGKGIAVMNMPLIAKFRDVLIMGKDDFLRFIHSKPFWLFEYKFTHMRIPPDSSHVQARLYSLLLNRMGFDISTLKYSIVLASHKPEQPGKWRKSVFKEVLNAGASKEEAVVNVENGRAFFRRPDLKKAEKELDWALGYWKCEREAIPTKKFSKCQACKCAEQCDTKPMQTFLFS